MDEGLNLNLELDGGLNCNQEKVKELYCNQDVEDDFNEAMHEELESNLQEVKGLNCNQETNGASEDSALEVNFEDSEDDIGIYEDISVGIDKVLEGKMNEQGKQKGKGKGQSKGKGNGRGKGKGEGKRKGKVKVGRSSKKGSQTGESSGFLDDKNIEDVPNENFKGLSDIDEYGNDEIPNEYDNDDENIRKANFEIFNISRRMEDYKWEVGTYFATKEDFKEGMRIYAIHSGTNLKFKKNDNKRMRLICKEGCPWEAYCENIPQEETWQLRKIIDKHTCSRDYKVRFLNSKWLGKKVQTNVRENPSLKLIHIMEMTHQK